MKINRKIATLALVLSLAITQSGCLFGLAFWPLWIVGSGVGLTGAIVELADGHYHRVCNHDGHDPDSCPHAHRHHRHHYRDGSYYHSSGVGAFLMLVGAILDEKNPGRADALNELPMSLEVSQEANVKASEIRDYNRNLDKIRSVGIELASDIQGQLQRKEEFSKYSSVEQLAQDPEINRLSQKYGFDNGSEFFNSFSKKSIPAAITAKFAKNLDLTEGQAKLMLRYGFGIQVQ